MSVADSGRSLKVLDEALRSTDYTIRLLAVETLGCFPAEAALVRLNNEGLADPIVDVRAASVEALWHHNTPLSRALLTSVRDDEQEDLSVRVLAARSLALPTPHCPGERP